MKALDSVMKQAEKNLLEKEYGLFGEHFSKLRSFIALFGENKVRFAALDFVKVLTFALQRQAKNALLFMRKE